MKLDDRTGLDPAARDALVVDLARLTSLHQVILWGLKEQRVVSQVVVQDEFSHDVILPWRAGRYLVFDTT